MQTTAKLLGLSLTLLALPALAQTIDGGQGLACNVDSDCGDVCGWVCDFNLAPPTCVPAIVNTANPGSEGIGWCEGSTGCACPGQTCQGVNCAPATFATATPQCVCDSDCPANEHCDSTLGMCKPPTTGSCNYDGECGCGCGCGNGSCLCTGLIPPTCSTDADCGPACYGYSCVQGACVHDEAACVVKNVPDGGSSSSSSSSRSSSSGGPSSASMGSSSSGGSSGSATTGPSGSSSSGSSGSATTGPSSSSSSGSSSALGGSSGSSTHSPAGGSSGGASGSSSGSSSGSTSNACVPGAACQSNSNCCGDQSCVNGVCHLPGDDTGCGCAAGAGGAEGAAMLALGLALLARRKRA